jgi:hypothetical protein
MKLCSWIVAVSVLGAPVMVRAQNNVVGELFASDASVRGSVLLAGTGTKVVSGSSVTAGDAPAVFRLIRGGDLRICPATSVTLTTSVSGSQLLVGMSTGSIESHYTLALSADTIMTPDFRILLAGPGTFNYAIKADDHGDVAIRALEGNTASLIVQELNGDGMYQVKPSEEVLFRNGKLANPENKAVPECGCPPPAVPIQRVAVEAPKEVAKATDEKKDAPLPPVPTTPVAEQHLEASVPFIYQAGDPAEEVVVGVARLRLTHGPVLPSRMVLPPPPPPVKETAAAAPVPLSKKAAPKKGLFGRVGAFFAAIFH